MEIDVSRCMADAIGSGGVDKKQLAAALERTKPVLATLRDEHASGALPLLGLPWRRNDIPSIKAAAERLSRQARDIVIFGTGGSSLGAQALAPLAGWGSRGAPTPIPSGESPRLHFMDNLDPHALAGLLNRLDPVATRFLVITKSGNTPETVVQMMAALKTLKSAGLGDAIAEHMLVITQPSPSGSNAARDLAERHGIEVLDHDSGLGGRYSVLSSVGLLPAQLMGLDIEAVRAGAADVLKPVIDGVAPDKIPSAVGAALHIAATSRRLVSASVLMAYGEALRVLPHWFVQLWAESLGKKGEGSLPFAASGPVDQHSALQLFLDGPDDKIYTIIAPDTVGEGYRLPALQEGDKRLSYLAGHTVGDLVVSQQRATVETLSRHGRPVRVIAIRRVDERVMGALFMHFMLETIIVARLKGVDPFDQPAVEESKILAGEYLARL